MTVEPGALVLLGLLTSSLHWLGARAQVSQPLWSRARGGWARLLACAGCSGFWLGLVLGIGGLQPCVTRWAAGNIVASAVLAVFLTPVFEGVLLWGLSASALQAADGDESSQAEAPPAPSASGSGPVAGG